MTICKDPVVVAQEDARRKAEAASEALRERMGWAIQRQAEGWGIRADQAQALLMDWRAVA